jgi:hypothetical protein
MMPMNATASPQETCYELSAYTLSHPDRKFIHQYVVDAFAAQRADEHTRPITLTFALVGLYLHIERDYSGRHVQRVHMLLARRRKAWPRFEIPRDTGSITVRDVMDAPPGPERDEMIRRWSESVWQAYSASRALIVELIQRELG